MLLLSVPLFALSGPLVRHPAGADLASVAGEIDSLLSSFGLVLLLLLISCSSISALLGPHIPLSISLLASMLSRLVITATLRGA